MIAIPAAVMLGLTILNEVTPTLIPLVRQIITGSAPQKMTAGVQAVAGALGSVATHMGQSSPSVLSIAGEVAKGLVPIAANVAQAIANQPEAMPPDIDEAAFAALMAQANKVRAQARAAFEAALKDLDAPVPGTVSL